MELLNSHQTFGGNTQYFSHRSLVCEAEMKFGVFLPKSAGTAAKCPGLIWLSGLTCNEQNFLTKAGAQRLADELGMILFAPDTSPKDLGIPGEKDRYDLGSAASFYIDAIQEPWAKNYKMETYVASEFYSLCYESFPVSSLGIFGHSMGGHGALTLALKYPDKFVSVSAFAPICAPASCDWGQRAFAAYLGPEQKEWAKHDASQLISRYFDRPILIDQGKSDEFLHKGQLRPEVFEQVCRESQVPLTLNLREGYDHSYYFIASFIDDHLRFHHAAARNHEF